MPRAGSGGCDPGDSQPKHLPRAAIPKTLCQPDEGWTALEGYDGRRGRHPGAAAAATIHEILYQPDEGGAEAPGRGIRETLSPNSS